MSEIWKDIEGYEGLYQISNYGNVKGQYGRILKLTEDKDGYLRVCLCKDKSKKYTRVHRLVASAFIPNEENLPCVNHKDENVKNNSVENLEWCTVKYNNLYGTRVCRFRKSKKRNVFQYNQKGEFIQEWESALDASTQLNINQFDIYSCCSGKRKTAGNYKWSHRKALV